MDTKKTAEEQAHDILLKHLGKGLPNVRSVYYERTIAAMLEFHAKLSEELPSDKEIEKRFELYHPAQNEQAKMACMAVAEWLRNRLQGGK